MGVDTLLGLLTRDAQAEADALLASARDSSTRMLERHAREAAEAREQAREGHERECREAVAVETAATGRRYRGALLAERAAVVERVFAEAERALAAADPARYQPALAGLLQEGLAYLAGTAARIHCRPEVAGQVRALLADRPDVSLEASPDAAAGVLVESCDGAIRIDCTLPGLLRRRREELAVALAARLGEP